RLYSSRHSVASLHLPAPNPSINLGTANHLCVFTPGWRNWQTQRTQNPPDFGPWGFDPPSRHQCASRVIARAWRLSNRDNVSICCAALHCQKHPRRNCLSLTLTLCLVKLARRRRSCHEIRLFPFCVRDPDFVTKL